jgi:hypothetical protein
MVVAVGMHMENAEMRLVGRCPLCLSTRFLWLKDNPQHRGLELQDEWGWPQRKRGYIASYSPILTIYRVEGFLIL